MGRKFGASFASGGNGLPFQGNLGGGAFRIGLSVAGSLAQHLVSNQHLDGKNRLVVRALHRNLFVSGGWPTHALNQFLQAGLGVIRGPTQAPNVVKARLKGPEDETAGRIVSLVKVNSRDQGFEGLFKDGFPVMTTRLHLSFAKGKIFAQGEATSGTGEAGAAYQRRASLGQLSFAYPRQGLVKLGGNDQFEYRVPQELHPFVGVQGGTALLVQVRAVDQGLSQQAPVAESYAQRGFQVFQGQFSTRRA